MGKVSAAAEARYTQIDAAWPDALPVLTGDEAASVARRLYRFAMGKAWAGSVKVTSGRRYTWIRQGVLSVNPGNGWKQIVHLLSHYAHRRLSKARPHSEEHAILELRMVRHVLDSGWLDGRFKKAEKPKPDVRALRQARIVKRLQEWERKAKRADTAIKKLRKQVKYYERTTA